MDEPTPKKVGHPGGASRRPVDKQSPEPTPKLTEDEKAVLDAQGADELFLSNQELTIVHVSMKQSREDAAKRVGLPLKRVREILAQPHVKLYAIQYRDVFMRTMAAKEAASLVRQGITPNTVQQRLMDLAMMPPSETKGSIDGQVKALTELSSHLKLKEDDPLAGKTQEELEQIVKQGTATVQ
jgi:hypothetical protein